MSRSRQAMVQPATSSTQVSQLDGSSTVRLTGTLRLRAENENDAPLRRDETPARRIRWSEDVVDNEGMGKKSSKICCIYHKARPVGESSSESESDSSSSDSESDAESGNTNSRRHCQHDHHESGDGSHEQSNQSSERGRTARCQNRQPGKNKRRKPSPNAYEKMPKPSRES